MPPVFANIGLSLLKGEPVLSGYVENIPDSLSHSALVPISTTLGRTYHEALSGPIGVLGTGDDRCHPIWLWDAVNGKVIGFDGSTFGNLPAVPRRQEYLDSRRDPDPLDEGADTYGSGTAMLFPFYGSLVLVMSVIVPESKVYVMRFNPDTLAWQELAEIPMNGAGPRSVAFSNAVNYRGGVTWMGGDSIIDKMLIFHLTDTLEVEVYPHNDPRGWELFKPIVTETAQQLKLMPTVEPHLDALMSVAAHAYSDRDITQSGVREAAREFLLDHHAANPLFGLRRADPASQMAKATRIDWPFVNPQGMCSMGGRLFFTNTLGQVCRYDERTGVTTVLFDVPWSVPEMQQGTFATDNDGSAVEDDFDFRLAKPTPDITPGFEHDGALPVEYWNSYCRLKIVSIPDTGDPGLNAKYATFIGREGIYSGLEDDKHWVLDLTGRPLFSSYLDSGTGTWERLGLPAGTVIDTAYAYGGCIDNELNAHAGINLHMMESGGHLYVMAMPALTRQSEGLVIASITSIACAGDDLEIVVESSDAATPIVVSTAAGTVTAGPGSSDPDVYAIEDNNSAAVTIRFSELFLADTLDLTINGEVVGHSPFTLAAAAVNGCRPPLYPTPAVQVGDTSLALWETDFFGNYNMVHSGTRPVKSGGFWETPSVVPTTSYLLVPGGADAGGVFPPLNTQSFPDGAQMALQGTVKFTSGNAVVDSSVVMQKTVGGGAFSWSVEFNGSNGNVRVRLIVGGIERFSIPVWAGWTPLIPLWGVGFKGVLTGTNLMYYYYWSPDGVNYTQVFSYGPFVTGGPSSVSMIDRISTRWSNWSGGSSRKAPIRNITNQVVLP